MIESRAELEERLGRIRQGIERACRRSGREPGEVRLVAVSKGVPAQLVDWALGLGVEDFGENFVQQLESKSEAVGAGRWHFVGTLQRHTVHRVAATADWVHSLAPGGATERIARRAADRDQGPLPSLVQVDFTGQRHGVEAEEAEGFARRVAGLEGLDVRGLMTLPPWPEQPEDSRPYFRRLRELREAIGAPMHELSMGMSDDYEVAVEEGATMVRIGTALFGARPQAPTG